VQGDLIDRDRLSACADLLMTTSPNVMVYAALDGWRRQMVQHGRELLGDTLELVRGLRNDIELIPDVEVLDDELLGKEASHDLDRLQILMDVSGTGTSGYQAADWLREHKQTDLGMSDHRRLLATMSFADDKASGERLLDALWAWRKAANDFRPACADPAAVAERDRTREHSTAPRRVLRTSGGGACRKGQRQNLRRADHAVSARHSGRGPRRAAQRRGDRLPSLRT